MSHVYAQPSIIQKRELLSDDHVPEQLLHRLNQLKAVASAIEPILHDRTPKTTLIHGPSGAGKTSLSRRFLNTLEDQDPKMRTGYVNCWEEYSEFDVLKALAKALGLTIIQGRISAKELFHRIERICRQYPTAIVLDEVDQLQGKKVLYRLGTTDAALTLVTNDDRLLFSVDERVKSRLGPLERVHFPPYSQAELEDIVEYRAQHALAVNSLSKGQLRRIAAASAGNAHLAIESLRLAAERAEEAGSDGIEDVHVEAAVENARQSVRTKSLDRLNAHQRLILQIIKEHEKIAAGDLHREYRERAAEPVTERAVRNYLRKLVQYGFIRKKNDGRWRIYTFT